MSFKKIIKSVQNKVDKELKYCMLSIRIKKVRNK